jgi:hypothetical protein
MTTPQKGFTLTSLVTTQLQSTATTEYSENCTTTSCTIFAETLPPNSTAEAINQTTPFVQNNETLVHDSPHDNDGENWVGERNMSRSTSTPSSQLVAVSGWSTNNPEVDAIFNKGGTNVSTTQFKMVLLDELLTPSSGQSVGSTTGLTSTTSVVVFPTLSINVTSSRHQETRKRHPVRRMY